MSVWDFVNDLSQFKKGIYTRDTKKDYNAFLVNRAFSMYPDTILSADEMNYYRDLDTLLQFDYYLHSVRPAKRFSAKWPKQKKDEDLNFVAEYFCFSPEKARAALIVMTDEQLEELRRDAEKGGVKK